MRTDRVEVARRVLRVSVAALIVAGLSGCAVVAEVWPGTYDKVDDAVSEMELTDFGDIELDAHSGGLTLPGPIREVIVTTHDRAGIEARLAELGYNHDSGVTGTAIWSEGETVVLVRTYAAGEMVYLARSKYDLQNDGVVLNVR